MRWAAYARQASIAISRVLNTFSRTKTVRASGMTTSFRPAQATPGTQHGSDGAWPPPGIPRHEHDGKQLRRYWRSASATGGDTTGAPALMRTPRRGPSGFSPA